MLHMFIHFPATTGMLWDPSKGMIPCAPPGRPFEREVLPRIYGAPPAPRPLPNFIGEPEGYSRKSFAASSVGSTASHPSYIRRASSHSSNAAPLGGPGPLIPNGAPLGGPGPLIRFDSGDTRPHSSHVASVIRAGNSYVGFNNPESKDHVSVCNGASRDGNNVDLNLVTPSFNGNLVGGFSSYTRFNSPLASLDAHAREFGPQQSGYEAGGCTHVPLDSTVSSEAALEKQSDDLCQQNRFYNFRFPVEQ